VSILTSSFPTEIADYATLRISPRNRIFDARLFDARVFFFRFLNTRLRDCGIIYPGLSFRRVIHARMVDAGIVCVGIIDLGSGLLLHYESGVHGQRLYSSVGPVRGRGVAF
jgi:hypothetical protein